MITDVLEADVDGNLPGVTTANALASVTVESTDGGTTTWESAVDQCRKDAPDGDKTGDEDTDGSPPSRSAVKEDPTQTEVFKTSLLSFLSHRPKLVST